MTSVPEEQTQTPSPGMSIHRRSDRSLLMRIVHLAIKPIRPRLVKPSTISAPGSNRLTPPRSARKRCEIHERSIEDIWLYDLTPIREHKVTTPRTDSGGSSSTDGRGGSAKEKTSREPGAAMMETGSGTGAGKTTKHIYYFAGGGWQMNPSGDHWVFLAEIACRMPTDTKITLVSYPLAPKTPVREALPQIRRMYDVVMNQSAESGERVILAGDSSGGNIALCVTLWALGMRQEGDGTRVPAAVMGICPSTDLRHNHPDIHAAAKKDPILTAKSIELTARAWCGSTLAAEREREGLDTAGRAETGLHPPQQVETAPTPSRVSSSLSSTTSTTPSSSSTSSAASHWGLDDPRVSPVLADLSLFAKHDVKVHGLTGTWDCLGPEAMVFRDRCQQKGVQGEWLEWEKQMHCFPLAFRYFLRESRDAVEWIVDVLERT